MIRTIPSTFDFFNFLSKFFSKILGLLKISKFDYFQNQSKWSPNGPKTPGIELSQVLELKGALQRYCLLTVTAGT